MKDFLTALAGAAFVAGAATVAFAQTTAPTQPHANPNTKVYAYQKAAPAKPATGVVVTNSPNEQLATSVPYGSLKWWEQVGRTAGGDGGQ